MAIDPTPIPQTGACTCKPGFSGSACQSACPPGRYGAGCWRRCSHCPGTQCHHLTGTCSTLAFNSTAESGRPISGRNRSKRAQLRRRWSELCRNCKYLTSRWYGCVDSKIIIQMPQNRAHGYHFRSDTHESIESIHLNVDFYPRRNIYANLFFSRCVLDIRSNHLKIYRRRSRPLILKVAIAWSRDTICACFKH